jgi:hypothetical protein
MRRRRHPARRCSCGVRMPSDLPIMWMAVLTGALFAGVSHNDIAARPRTTGFQSYAALLSGRSGYRASQKTTPSVGAG